MAARIGPLRDAPGQHDRARRPARRDFEPRDVVAEIGRDRADGSGAAPAHGRCFGPALTSTPGRAPGAIIEIDRVLGTHEARDEWRLRAVVDLLRARRPGRCGPASITTMRSAMVMASSRSCVTCTAVKPRRFCSVLISLTAAAARTLASRFDKRLVEQQELAARSRARGRAPRAGAVRRTGS